MKRVQVVRAKPDDEANHLAGAAGRRKPAHLSRLQQHGLKESEVVRRTKEAEQGLRPLHLAYRRLDPIQRERKPEGARKRRRVSQPYLQLLHVAQVDILLEHHQAIEFNEGDARRYEPEYSPEHGVPSHFSGERGKIAWEFSNRRSIRDARFGRLEDTDVIVCLPPFLR